MKLNSDKCHLLVSGHHYEEMFVNTGKDIIWESKTMKLLGITIDKELLNHNSNTVPWFGCFAAKKAMIKSIGFMKDH